MILTHGISDKDISMKFKLAIIAHGHTRINISNEKLNKSDSSSVGSVIDLIQLFDYKEDGDIC